MLGSYQAKNRIFSNIESESTRSILSGLIGGAVAATLQSPVELTMTYQHKFGETFLHQVKNIVDSKGLLALGTGYLGTAFRLGLYTCSFFSLQPLLKKKLTQDYQVPDGPAHLLSSVGTGTFSTYVSNPADVVKTIQHDELPTKKLSIPEAVGKVYARDGWRGFFKGTLSRNARVCSGIAIISEVNSVLSDSRP